MSSPASQGFFFASPPAAAGLLVLGLAAFWREAFEGLALDPPPKRHGLLARAGTLASSAHHKRNVPARADDPIGGEMSVSSGVRQTDRPPIGTAPQNPTKIHEAKRAPSYGSGFMSGIRPPGIDTLLCVARPRA
eukprot:scaffold9603_cov65-Phaeocystis_antarctica.AAC.5